MFSESDRARVRASLLDRAEGDARIVAAAITGSAALDAEDRWSDVDLAFGVAASADRDEVIADWTRTLEREFRTVHHWDLPSMESLFRGFLLPDGLEVDISFTPETAFGAYTPRFKLVFGSSRELPTPGRRPGRELVGYAWHHALHAHASIARGESWQAVQLISILRGNVFALACTRLGLPAAVWKGFDALPPELRERLEPSLVASLAAAELRRALSICTEALLDEIARDDPRLASALASPLGVCIV